MNIITNILHRWNDICRLQEGERIWPKFCDFHTSNRCNQHCLGCAYAGTIDGKMMTEGDHFAIVDQLAKVGVRAFDFAGGGEPTMLPYLPRLMEHMRERRLHFALITNGLMMNGELIKALVAGATYVRFSLEASCKEDYAKYKQVDPRHWDIVLENIAALRSAKISADNPLEISIKFAVGRSLRGKDHYERCICLGRELGARRVTIKALRHQPEELSERDRIAEDAILNEAIRQEDARDLISYWIAPIRPDNFDHCWLSPLHTVVDHNGNVFVCCYYYNDRQSEMWIGNMLNQRFEDFWMGPRHRELLRRIRREKCLEQDCKFQLHTMAIAQAMNRGHIEWL